jgi:anaerobic magnesium-protoporphyrin IX monomethyl ester cyclase
MLCSNEEREFMAKIAFIEPRCSFNSYGYYRFPLMGSLCLGTILNDSGHEVMIFRDSVRSVYDKGREWLNDTITKADVVAFSLMTATTERGYQIADAIRKVAPKIRIIIGGPHPTYMSEEALQHADLVVKGEGEEIIIDAVENRNLVGIIQGPPVDDLTKYPIPNLSILTDKNRPPRQAPISTSRGCPYDCIFCTVSSIFGRKCRFREPGSVLEEIKMRVSEGFKKLFFYDDNFAISRERTKELLRGILRTGLNKKMSWSAEARTDIAKDDELLDLMSKANCNTMLIGFESINPEALKEYNKKQELEDIKICVKKLHEHGIRVHGMFVLGSDADDSNTARDTVKFCHETKMASVQFSVLHPLPGSRLYDILESQDRIFSKKWSLYDGSHVVFKPLKMSPVELQEKFIWAWKKFYSFRNPLYFAASRYVINSWQNANKVTIADLKARFKR